MKGHILLRHKFACCDTGCLNCVTLGNVSLSFWKLSWVQPPFCLGIKLTCTKRAIWLASATKRCDTSCREGVLATLRNALQKVELTSTFCNDCGNKKIATNVYSRVCHSRQYSGQLVLQQNCETSCKRKCNSAFMLHAEVSDQTWELGSSFFFCDKM